MNQNNNPSSIGSYNIICEIKNSQQSIVYEVEHKTLHVRRALKLFRLQKDTPDWVRKKFITEGRILALLNHPRIVHMHDFEIDSQTGQPYYTMDLIKSPQKDFLTLAKEATSEDCDERKLYSYFRDLCEGLDYLSQQGVVHRDIKLENMLVDPDGHIVLIDFGLSCLLDAKRENTPFEKDNLPIFNSNEENQVGTCFYYPPEFYQQDINYSSQTDAWALGVAMFRLLTQFWFENSNRKNYLPLADNFDLPWIRIFEWLLNENPDLRLPPGGFNALPKLLMPSSHNSRWYLMIFAMLLLSGSCCWMIYNNRKMIQDLKSLPAATATQIHPMHFQKLCLDHMRNAGLPLRVYHTNQWARAYREVFTGLVELPEPVQKVLQEESEVANSRGIRLGRSLPTFVKEATENFLLTELGRPFNETNRLTAARQLAVASALYANEKYYVIGGDFPTNREYVAQATWRFARCYRRDPEWLYENLYRSEAINNPQAYLKVINDKDLQHDLPHWLLNTWRFQSGAGLVDTASDRQYETNEPYSAHIARLTWAHDYNTIWKHYQACASICADDLRVVRLMVEKLKDFDLAESFLDAARLSDRYETLLPSFYVTERWFLLANGYFDADNEVCQKWYADKVVRKQTLEVIKKYQTASGLTEEAPRQRHMTEAIFAAVAEMCGEDDWARYYIRQLPTIDACLYMQRAVSPKTKLFQRLLSYQAESTTRQIEPAHREVSIKPKQNMQIKFE